MIRRGGERGRGIKILSKLLYLCLDVLNTGLQETVENKPVFDPDFHTELIIKDEFEDLYSCAAINGNGSP